MKADFCRAILVGFFSITAAIIFGQTSNGEIYSASSVLVEGQIEYSADKAFDGKLDTAWCESVNGLGKGEWIQVEFESPLDAIAISIHAGFQSSQSLFARNSVPSEVWLTINGNMPISVDLRINEEFGFGDAEGLFPMMDASNFAPRIILLPEPEEISSLRVEIRDVIAGIDWEDTLISEVRIITADEANEELALLGTLLGEETSKASEILSRSTSSPDPTINLKDEINNMRMGRSQSSPRYLPGNHSVEYWSTHAQEFSKTLVLYEKDGLSYIVGDYIERRGASEWIVVFPTMKFDGDSISFDELVEEGGVPSPITRTPTYNTVE